MDKNKVIDLLHAIMHQLDGRTVTLDGESFFIEEICEFAIKFLEELN